MPRRRRQAGLSLLEVLVTVTLFAMLFAVLAQGWFQAAQAQSRLTQAAAQLRQRQYLVLTLRRFVAESVSQADAQGASFRGDASSITAESSHAPGVGAGAAPVPVRLAFAGRPLQLTLESPGQPAWRFEPAFDEAVIDYIDGAGSVHEQWPPALATSATVLTRPALLRLTLKLQGQSQRLVLLAAPRASGFDLPDDGIAFINTEPQ